MVQKIVEKHVQATSPTAAASKTKKAQVAESPKASRGAQNDNPNPVKAEHAETQKPVIGYDEFLRLQEQAARGRDGGGAQERPLLSSPPLMVRSPAP